MREYKPRHFVRKATREARAKPARPRPQPPVARPCSIPCRAPVSKACIANFGGRDRNGKAPLVLFLFSCEIGGMLKPPLDAPLSLLHGYWLETRCRCKLSYTPMAKLSERVGASTRLGEVLSRLKCENCGERPSELALVDDPAAGASGVPFGREQMRVPLT